MRILIIGYGSIGRRHHEILSGLYPKSEFVLVTKQTLPNIRCITAISEISQGEIFDYIVIASESFRHYEDTCDILELVEGTKILVEKPLFIHPERIPALGSNKIFVGYNLRFHPVMTFVAKLLIGAPVVAVNIEAGQYLPTWRPDRDYRTTYSASIEKGGGVVLDLSHEIDYAQWLFGRITKLCAYNSKISELDITSDDYLTMIGITDQKTVVSVILDYLSRIPRRKMNIQTKRMTIEVDMIAGRVSWSEDGGVPNIWNADTLDRNYSYIRMHQSILEGEESACSFSEGLDVVRTIELIRKNNRKEWE